MGEQKNRQRQTSLLPFVDNALGGKTLGTGEFYFIGEMFVEHLSVAKALGQKLAHGVNKADVVSDLVEFPVR